MKTRSDQEVRLDRRITMFGTCAALLSIGLPNLGCSREETRSIPTAMSRTEFEDEVRKCAESCRDTLLETNKETKFRITREAKALPEKLQESLNERSLLKIMQNLNETVPFILPRNDGQHGKAMTRYKELITNGEITVSAECLRHLTECPTAVVSQLNKEEQECLRALQSKIATLSESSAFKN